MSTRRKKRNKIFFVNKKYRRMLLLTLSMYLLFVVIGAMLVTLFLPKKHFIYYDGETFTPQGLTIKFGDSVSIKNNAPSYMEFAIGQHANHKTLKGFEEKVIEANTVYTFAPQENGIFDFHNHLNPKKIGVLIINE